MRVKTFIRLFLLAVMGLLLWYLRRWGLPPAVLLTVVLIAVAWFGVWFMNVAFKRTLATPLKLKGAALEGAGVIVHGIEEAAPPAPPTTPPTAGRGADSRRWYHVELTIVPLPDSSVPAATEGDAARPHFRFWDPLELVLAPTGSYGRDPQARHAAKQDDEPCVIRDIEVHRGKGYRRLDRELRGSQRLRLYIGVVPGCEHLQLHYYLARLGNIALPPTTG